MGSGPDTCWGCKGDRPGNKVTGVTLLSCLKPQHTTWEGQTEPGRFQSLLHHLLQVSSLYLKCLGLEEFWSLGFGIFAYIQ